MKEIPFYSCLLLKSLQYDVIILQYKKINSSKTAEISQNSFKTFPKFIWFSRLSLQRCSSKVCGRKKSKKIERKGDAGNNG